MIRHKIAGLDTVLRLLTKVKSKRRQNSLIRAGLNSLGRTLVKLTKKKVPKRSGTMRRSIQKSVRQSKKNPDVFFLLVGIRSKFEGAFEGKKVISHKVGHLVTGRRKQFTQRIVMTPGKKLVVYRKFVEGKQTGLSVISNRGNIAKLHIRKVGKHAPNDIFSDARRYGNRALVSVMFGVLRKMLL